MLLMGIDVGTSSVKVSVVNGNTMLVLAAAQYPETEAEIISLQPGWAEQLPADWWFYTQQAILKANATGIYHSKDIGAIGISYQMHGLVCLDKEGAVLRNSIIWCDSRAVEIGDAALAHIGNEKALSHLLNSPGNFTASKLAWVKTNEPVVYEKIDKIMLPGDFIALQLTGSATTSIAALSEGVFWDFKNQELSQDVMKYYGLNPSFIPQVKQVFDVHGLLNETVAASLSLSKNIAVSYKAGDQPNNAFSLNVLNPGEVAATAGTSGVIYAVTDTLLADKASRVNSFAHVNYSAALTRIGVLLCINGTGIMNKWARLVAGSNLSYPQLNELAAQIPQGSEGLMVFPFGNGAERMFHNKIVGAHIENIDLNKHTPALFLRATQEGIAFSFRFGLDILRENGINPSVIKAGKANMFLSDVFAQSFVNATDTPLELYNNDGSMGAAIGAGIGAGLLTQQQVSTLYKPHSNIYPAHKSDYDALYWQWKEQLLKKTE